MIPNARLVLVVDLDDAPPEIYDALVRDVARSGSVSVVAPFSDDGQSYSLPRLPARVAAPEPPEHLPLAAAEPRPPARRGRPRRQVQ